MANNPFYSDAAVIAALDNLCANCNSGFLAIYSGAQPGDANQALTGTLLAKLPFSATAFATALASGATGSRIVTATANAITPAAAQNTGTAGYFALLKSNGTTVVAMGSVGTGTADLVFNSLSITATNQVSCSAFTLTTNE